ncbi:hypothetical protein ABMA28_004027 [Loxostege sticticalis]|uniref:DDE Tnp4 domain-containing protein n=1 Tax=Loxostege sticticalis TaxID=481309 RepID=A0ABD0SU10_LOXSC
MSEDDFTVAFLNDVVEEAEIAAALPLRRQCQYRKDAFLEQRPRLFQKNFRLSKELTQNLMRIIEPVIVKKTEFDLKTKVLCALNFFGHGSYQSPVGENVNMNMSQPSVSRCIAEVTEALNHPEVFDQWVKFPSTFQELNQIVRDFYSTYGLPGVIGCLDCTHCAIVPSDTINFDERSYVNRKNYHSINTQLICDANLKIINVNALFPGSTHDCHIWNSSRVLTFMEQLYNNGHTNYHLIG